MLTSPRVRSVARWGLHVGAYLLVLVGLLAVAGRTDGWNLDDGAYATQVRVLHANQGETWAYPYRHRDVDPASRFAPVSHAATTAEATYAYVKQPAWIQVLRASSSTTDAVADPAWGLYLPSVLGAVLAALVAGIMASRLAPLEPRAGALGFWAVALGPLVVHTQAMWAHTMAAALGGAAALGLVALAQGRGRWWHPLGMAAATAALVSLRAEGLLFTLALGVTVAGVVLAGDPSARGPVRAVAWAGPVFLAGTAARVLSSQWAARLAPGPLLPGQDTILSDVGRLEGRTRGAARTLLDGVGASQAGTFLAVVVVVLAVVAGLALRRSGARGPGPVLLGGAVAAAVVRTLVAPDDLGGFLVALPLVPAGLAAWRWRGAPVAEQALVGLAGLYTLAVLATQYPEGGSRDWGGRFLFPVLVPLVVVAVLTLWRTLTVASSSRAVAESSATEPSPIPAGSGAGRAAGLLLVGLLAVVAVPTAAGLRAAGVARSSNRALTEVTLAVDVPTVVRIPRYLTRTSWRALPEHDWLSAEVSNAPEALALLRPGRTEPVAVVGNGADQVRAPGYRREVRSPVVVIFTPT